MFVGSVRLGVLLGLRPRPSLSAAPSSRRTCSASVAGASAPAFVERHIVNRSLDMGRGVAGASAPAFVERSCSTPSRSRSCGVLLGLRPRPSLSVGAGGNSLKINHSVAGASAPAFVERPPSRARRALLLGLRPRPSLSVRAADLAQALHGVLLGLRPRPSLSAEHWAYESRRENSQSNWCMDRG